MYKRSYPQPSSEFYYQDATVKADIDAWRRAYRNIWRLVKITGASFTQAKKAVLQLWPLGERSKFESWVHYYELEDDLKYKKSYIDCDLEAVKIGALKIASGLPDSYSTRFTRRITTAKDAQTIVDYIYAMRALPTTLQKTAAPEESTETRMFRIIRDIHMDMNKKRLIRNLARILAMDKDGSYPEIGQVLSKLIDAYNYSMSRVQDVMSRLGLQMSVAQSEEEGDDKLTEKLMEAEPAVKSPNAPPPTPETPAPAKEEKAPKMFSAPKPPPTETKEETPALPRTYNRGL